MEVSTKMKRRLILQSTDSSYSHHWQNHQEVFTKHAQLPKDLPRGVASLDN